MIEEYTCEDVAPNKCYNVERYKEKVNKELELLKDRIKLIRKDHAGLPLVSVALRDFEDSIK